MRCWRCNTDGIPLDAVVCPNSVCKVHLPSLNRDLLPHGSLLKNGEYKIAYGLGKGGYGITYHAEQIRLNRPVAIKEFFPEEYVMRNPDTKDVIVAAKGEDTYRKNLERFTDEGRTLAQINHPNVVRAIDLFQEHGTAYLVMELIQGKPLRAELDNAPKNRLAEERVRDVMSQMVSALATTHAMRIYHLDLKPQNVMVTGAGQVILVDFGAARQGFPHERGKSMTTTPYTQAYAPLEVLARKQAGARTDIFELGVMLYEMLTGQLPPDAVAREYAKEKFDTNDLEEPWSYLISSAMELKEEVRPGDVAVWWNFEAQHREHIEESRREAEASNQRRQTEVVTRDRQNLAATIEQLQMELHEMERVQMVSETEFQELQGELDARDLELQQWEAHHQARNEFVLLLEIGAMLRQRIANFFIRLAEIGEDAVVGFTNWRTRQLATDEGQKRVLTLYAVLGIVGLLTLFVLWIWLF